MFGFLLSLFGVLTPTLAAADENTILNPSFEVVGADPSMLSNWSVGGYGQNDRQFVRASGTAHAGDYFGRIIIENYVDGDAKWVSDAVAVTAGDTYYYSDHYRSSVPTRVVIRFSTPECLATDTGCIYANVATLGTANDWQKAQASFVVPDGVVSVTTYHLIESAGQLDIDDVSLQRIPPLEVTDNVPNNSLEVSYVDGASPLGWTQGGWGANNPSFEYIQDDGHDGSRSVKVTIEDYVNGDAKWIYAGQPIEGGKDYRFSAWYKTNTNPSVVIEFKDQSGAVTYFTMPRPVTTANTVWQEYSQVFTAPDDAISATVYLFLTSNGWLQTDDYHLTPFVYEGFERPLVSITFDDGNIENVTTALPILNDLGFASTQCYLTGKLAGDQAAIDGVLAFHNSGHEICSHGISHADFTSLNAQSLNDELIDSRNVLSSLTGVLVTDIASPYGMYNSAVIAAVKDTYAAHRTVDPGYNARNNFDQYRLRVQNVFSDTTPEEFGSWIDKAVADNTWLILVYHKVDGSDIEQYDSYLNDFEEQMQLLADSGVTVKRLDGALAEVMQQLYPITCESGTHLEGNICVDDPLPTCENGTHLEGGVCVDDPLPTCESGTHLEGNVCIKDEKKKSGGGGGSSSRSSRKDTASLPFIGQSSGVVLGTSTSTTSTTTIVFGTRFLSYLTVGSSGEEVSALQEFLQQGGWYSGPVTGYFGSLTQAAVKNFQRQHGIAETGTVGPQTREALNRNTGTSERDLLLMREKLLALISLLQEQLALLQSAQTK